MASGSQSAIKKLNKSHNDFSVGKGLTAQSDGLSSVLGTQRRELTLASCLDLHVDTVAHVCTHAQTHMSEAETNQMRLTECSHSLVGAGDEVNASSYPCKCLHTLEPGPIMK